MSDSVKKFYEMHATKHKVYPGDAYYQIDNPEKMIHESPDGGETVKSRPFREPYTPDTVVQEAIDMFTSRAKKGLETYGTTMDRNDLSLEQWLEHAIEEQADNLLYLIKALKELRKG